ncbi:MAG: hypothetical protein HOP17_18005 [Acidobacteria bacterium]|nr:hypothetical protein [Acidobacteriota bacterium]
MIRYFTGIAFAILAVTSLPVLTAAQLPSASSNAMTGVTTLYSRDPLGQSLCFRDGAYGSVFQDNEVRNRCSDINFNGYKADAFTVGVEGGKEGVILNVGKPADIQKIYKYEETVGGGQGFASLKVGDGKVWILQDRRTGTSQQFKDADALFQKPTKENKNAAVSPGSIYLLRLTDRNDKSFELAAKLIVISHVPGESVTFRWQVL